MSILVFVLLEFTFFNGMFWNTLAGSTQASIFNN